MSKVENVDDKFVVILSDANFRFDVVVLRNTAALLCNEVELARAIHVHTLLGYIITGKPSAGFIKFIIVPRSL